MAGVAGGAALCLSTSLPELYFFFGGSFGRNFRVTGRGAIQIIRDVSFAVPVQSECLRDHVEKEGNLPISRRSPSPCRTRVLAVHPRPVTGLRLFARNNYPSFPPCPKSRPRASRRKIFGANTTLP